MPTHWIVEKYDAATQAQRSANKLLHAHPDSVAPFPTPNSDRRLTNKVRQETRFAADCKDRAKWLSRWDVMAAVLGGGVMFFFLKAARFGAFVSAMTVAGVVAAAGLRHYLLWPFHNMK